MKKKYLIETTNEFVRGKFEKINERLSQTTSAFERYADRVKIIGLRNKEYLNIDSKNYVDQLSVIDFLGITNKNFKIFWNFPHDAHIEKLVFDQSMVLIQKKVFEISGNTQLATISNAIPLRSGGEGAIVVIPPKKFDRNKYFIFAILNYKKLFNGLFDPKDFSFQVVENDKMIFLQKSLTKYSRDDILKMEIPLGLSRTTISIYPTLSYLKSNSGSLPTIILIFCEIMTILLTILSWRSAKSNFDKGEFNRIEAESLARLNIALETSNIAAWSIDLENGEVWRSTFHDQLFGYEKQLLIWNQEIFFSHVHQDDLERVQLSFSQSLNIPGFFELEFRITPMGGKSLRWLKLVIMTNRADLELHKRVRGTIRDISLEKQREIKNTLELEWRKAILNAADYSMIATDKSGTILTFNKRAEEMLEYLSDEIVGKQTPAVFHDLDEVIHRSKILSSELNRHIAPGV